MIISLEGLFPDGVEVATADPAKVSGSLFPEEEAAVGRAIDKRKREFLAGRDCARRALRALGVTPSAIPVRSNRAPAWPDGVVGSITHCDGLAAAAVGWRREFAGIGLDAERAEPLRDSLSRLICTEGERRWMADREPPVGTDWVKLVFSAKEAVYKCVGPLVGRWIGFKEVELEVDAVSGSFEVRPARDEPFGVRVEEIDGRYRVDSGLVVSTAVLREAAANAT